MYHSTSHRKLSVSRWLTRHESDFKDSDLAPAIYSFCRPLENCFRPLLLLLRNGARKDVMPNECQFGVEGVLMIIEGGGWKLTQFLKVSILY